MALVEVFHNRNTLVVLYLTHDFYKTYFNESTPNQAEFHNTTNPPPQSVVTESITYPT